MLSLQARLESDSTKLLLDMRNSISPSLIRQNVKKTRLLPCISPKWLSHGSTIIFHVPQPN